MWYKNFPSVRDDENYVERKLINEKSYISLLFFQSGIGRAKEAEGIIIQTQEESRTLTLTYLQDLLERGEVKVLVNMPRIATKQEVDTSRAEYIKKHGQLGADNYQYGDVYRVDWIKVFDHTNADKAITEIRKGWEKFDPTVYEMGIEITLPENNPSEWETSDLWINERAKGNLI